MQLSRRDAIKVSSTAVAGLSMGVVGPDAVLGREQPSQEWPGALVEGEPRVRAELPLNPDGSAPEHPPEAAGEIEGTIWRYTAGEPPDIDFDYRNLSIRLDSRCASATWRDFRGTRWSRCCSVVRPRHAES
jgi:hypothetical protein